jgi:hypothetical protein
VFELRTIETEATIQKNNIIIIISMVLKNDFLLLFYVFSLGTLVLCVYVEEFLKGRAWELRGNASR